MKDKLKKKLKKVVPFILIAVLSCTAVLFSYDKGNEVQAAVVVDDIMVVTTILALCGVSFLGTEELWGDGNGWYPGINAGQDIDEWIDDFNKPWSEEWDEKTREYALEHGLIDENGNYTGGGDGNGDGGDDDDHKFPSWQKIKNLVKANGGNVATALGAYLPLLTGFAQSVLYDSGSNVADKILDNGFNFDVSYVDKFTIGYGRSNGIGYTKHFSGDCVIFEYSVPVCYFVDDSTVHILGITDSSDTDMCSLKVFRDGEYRGEDAGGFGYVNSYENIVINDISYTIYDFYRSAFTYDYHLFCSKFDTAEQCVKYLKKQAKNNTNSKKYINPTSIGTNSNLKDKMQTGVDGIPVLPTLPINNFAKVPTMDDLKDFFKKIGNDKDDKDKRQKDIDDFIKKITTADTGGGETPNPNPSPDPGGGETPDPNPDTGKDPDKNPDPDPNPKPDPNPDTGKDTDNNSFTADLKELFPFCIPFDIVDCFRLFNAEPETPRVKVPIHFGIVDKDYTFDIDLKDFNDVAGVCRTSFLILFMVGLGFATSKVIKW